jgi:hypothetical protein
MRRLQCPATTEPCNDGRCKRGHCLREIKDQVAANKAKEMKEATDLLNALGVRSPHRSEAQIMREDYDIFRDPDGTIHITEKKR